MRKKGFKNIALLLSVCMATQALGAPVFVMGEETVTEEVLDLEESSEKNVSVSVNENTTEETEE